MSLKKNSTAAYADCRFVMDLAITKPGLKYVCETAGKAINFKQRCNIYRNLLRQIATDSVMHVPGQVGTTSYDVLVVRQVNENYVSDRKGAILVFEHHRPEGKIIDPETGDEIKFGVEPEPKGSLFE
jgi:hypothetical protein